MPGTMALLPPMITLTCTLLQLLRPGGVVASMAPRAGQQEDYIPPTVVLQEAAP